VTETATAPEWATAYTELALAALPADITTATPPQVDEVIRTVQLDAKALQGQARRALDTLHVAQGERQVQSDRISGHDYRNRPQYAMEWPTTDAQAYRAAQANADKISQAYPYEATLGELVAAYDALVAQIHEAKAIEQAGHDEFDRRGGWTRYWIVANTGGHVHTTTACRTCYATTEFGWPTQLSGADGDQVVEAAGPLTCLTCFPEQREDILANRPVRFDAFETPEQRDERLKREAALNERNAAKIAKGVTPDGKPLNLGKVDYCTVEVKTARAAELRYVEFAANAQRRRYDDEQRARFAAAAATLIEALAWKQGATVEATTAKYAARLAKKLNDPYG
jgi:hypothetical protein